MVILVRNRVRAAKVKRDLRLSAWTNAKTGLTPSGLARLFSASHLSGELQRVAEEALREFAVSPKRAKALLDQVAISEFGDVSSVYHWQQFKALFAKSTDSATNDRDREVAAFEAFLASEKRCSRYNRKLAWYCKHPNRMPENIRVVWSRAREIIRSALGEFTPERLWDLIERGYPGSGISIGTRDREAVSPPFKYGFTDLCCTKDALPYARALVESSAVRVQCIGQGQEDGTFNLVYKLVEGNRLSFVNKDATIKRTIAVEPSLNVELQLGVHQDWAERVLPRLGVTVNDQSQNRKAAEAASRNWEDVDPDVTLDLRNSSGSLCREFVRAFIPDNGWLGYLDDLRSKSYSYNGTQRDYEMWSSMGNGYTFVLQCLIYMALCRATLSLTDSEGTPRVFGDDIVVPRGCAALLIETLKFFGISINTDKSYLFGPFRESCGGDYWQGTDVVPVYLRGIKELRAVDAYRVINHLRSMSDRIPTGVGDLATVIQNRLQGNHPTVPPWFPADSGIRSATFDRVFNKWEQQWYVLRVGFAPIQVRHEPAWGYAAALRGAREFQFFDELVLSARRGRGRYGLVASPAIAAGDWRA